MKFEEKAILLLLSFIFDTYKPKTKKEKELFNKYKKEYYNLCLMLFK